jgi:dTMP kinase
MSSDSTSAPAPTPTQRGIFIVFEGIDRAGKTTQAALLADYLRSNGKSVVEWRFPEYTVSHTGKLLRSYLDSGVKLDARTQHLLFAANRAEWVGNIEAILKQGTTIICDRYVYSGIAYSTAKGLDYEWCCSVEKGLPTPDLTILMQLDPKVAASRADYGKDLHDTVEFQNLVDSAYRHLFNTSCAYTVTVDASLAIDNISLEIFAAADHAYRYKVTTFKVGQLST